MVKSLLAKAQDSGLIPLSKEMATHSSILAWEIPWTEEPSGLRLIGLQKSQHNLATKTTIKGESMDKALLKCLQRIKVWHFYCSLRLQSLCSSYNIALCHQAHWWLSIFLKGGWLLSFRFFFRAVHPLCKLHSIIDGLNIGDDLKLYSLFSLNKILKGNICVNMRSLVKQMVFLKNHSDLN